LRHSRKERQAERDHSLKKDVYIEFASDLQESLRAFSKLTDLQASLEAVTETAQKASCSSAKLQLIAPPETIAALVAFNHDAASTFLELLPDAVRLRHRQFDTDLSVKAIADAQAEQLRIIELMKQINMSGEKNLEKMQMLQSWYENSVEIYKDECSQRDSSTDAVRELQQQLSIRVSQAMEALESKSNKLFSRLRMDIRVDEDGGLAYRTAAKVNYDELRKNALEAIKNLPRE
jgi:predicted HicB family RNase H-like nuclease